MILESTGPVRIPKRYLNSEGQIKMGSPYSERDFHGPTELNVIDEESDTEILVKDGPRWTCVTMAHNPFDVVGWDGYVYPFTFNAQDFEPITGMVHQPPPIHQTFEIRGYVVCTFAPRLLDYHPEAVKIPWVHDNVEADEVLFYVRGNFGSRKGIEAGSITLAPAGDSAWTASGDDNGEQKCRAHRRTRGHVRHRAHARADRSRRRDGRRQISVKLARLMSVLQNHETELEAAQRRIRSIPRCGAARVESLQTSFREILEAVGENPEREGLLKTPLRAAKAFEFLTNGYRQDLDEIVNQAIFTSDASEIILVKDIELYSMCEHHLLPFIGKAHVAYIPNGKVLGLSKVARIVDVFARRLQIQEQLTTQIADAIMQALHPAGVAVVIEAKHLCMMMRGVEKQNSVMTTSCLLGSFKEDARTRTEFLSLLRQ